VTGGKQTLRERCLGAASIALFFLGWELIARTLFAHSRSFPPPSSVLTGFEYWISSGTFAQDILVSLSRVAVGFSLGSVLGLILGALAGFVKPVRLTTASVIQMLRPVPPIALVTLAIIWFGIGELSKYFLVTWAVFFQVWLSTYLGVSRVEPRLLWAGRSLGASGIVLATKVTLPAALPNIIIGLRTGVAMAYFSLLAAELAGSFRGIGFRMDLSTSYFRSDVMMAAIVTLGVVGAFSDAVFAKAVNLAFPWYGATRS
jgi:ABC-type nitrate/sulfonate/bicarbonate transport system permease component